MVNALRRLIERNAARINAGFDRDVCCVRCGRTAISERFDSFSGAHEVVELVCWRHTDWRGRIVRHIPLR